MVQLVADIVSLNPPERIEAIRFSNTGPTATPGPMEF